MISRDNDACDLSIIIVSWNTCGLLRDCLESIQAYTHNYKYKIWVVDNNLNDNTVDVICTEFPEVRLIANGYILLIFPECPSACRWDEWAKQGLGGGSPHGNSSAAMPWSLLQGDLLAL